MTQELAYHTNLKLLNKAHHFDVETSFKTKQYTIQNRYMHYAIVQTLDCSAKPVRITMM